MSPLDLLEALHVDYTLDRDEHGAQVTVWGRTDNAGAQERLAVAIGETPSIAIADAVQMMKERGAA